MDESNQEVEAPVRLCCGRRHFGPVCSDGKVMCCMCFNRVSQDELNITADGQKEDVCKKCVAQEGEMPDPNEAWAEVELYRWQHGKLPMPNEVQLPLDEAVALRNMADAFLHKPPEEWPGRHNTAIVLIYVAKLLDQRPR